MKASDNVGETFLAVQDPDTAITWRRNVQLPIHPSKSTFGCTSLKKDAQSKFETPLQSFLAFLPVPIWQTMLKETIRFCAQQREAHPHGFISGNPWSSELTLTELMTFISILLEMTLHPTPGRSYVHMWTNQSLYPFTKHITITRFRQLRSIIHLNNNNAPAGSSGAIDPLAKIRPMLQVLKETLPSCLDVGDELALDEASVASKSKYGRFLIMYNPMKPGGKFHYRFYFVCDSDHYNLLRFSMHTRNNADLADGFNTALLPPEPVNDVSDSENEDVPVNTDCVAGLPSSGSATAPPVASKITQLLLDLLSPYKDSYRVVNMDRFYNGPEQAVAMLSAGVLCRGTFMTTRKLAPASIRFTKKDARTLPRGSYRMAVSVEKHMTIFGWNDGNGVHMLSTADGTEISTVTRQIGATQKQIVAPSVVGAYNKGMQGVDRHDQLRHLFSLARRHQFRKYYITLILALIDFAVVNANIHYHMRHSELKKIENTVPLSFNSFVKVCAVPIGTNCKQNNK
jgi:hypothetical protein